MQRRLQHGDWTRGALLPAERELCAEYQTTRTTLRRAFAVLAREGWLTNSPGRGMVVSTPRPAGNAIVLLDAPDLENVSQVAHITRRLAGHGIRLVPDEGQLLPPDVAAAISFSGASHPVLPTVSLGVRGAIGHIESVAFDHGRAAYEATWHLLQHGAQRIGVTGALDGRESTHLRYQGFLRAMREAGKAPQPSDALFVATDLDRGFRTEALCAQLRSSRRPDGLVILQAECSEAVIGAAVAADLVLPEELRLIAIGRPTPVAVGDCGLSSIEFDRRLFEDFAVMAITRCLLSARSPAHHMTVAPTLYVRGLCGAPAGKWCHPTPAKDAITRYITRVSP